jgi:hypothetical protein
MYTGVEHELDHFVQQDTDGGDSHPVLQHTDTMNVTSRLPASPAWLTAQC